MDTFHMLRRAMLAPIPRPFLMMLPQPEHLAPATTPTFFWANCQQERTYEDSTSPYF